MQTSFSCYLVRLLCPTALCKVSAEWEQPDCCLLGDGSSAVLRSWVQEEGGGGCRGLWLHPSDLPLLSAQMAGLLCEEEVLEVDNVKYCGYCKYHFSKMVSLPALQ